MDASYMLTGASAPEALTLTVTPNAAIPDLTAVTGATFVVHGPDNVRREWPATIVSQTSGQLVLSHAFAVGDQDQAGEWRVTASLQVPGGERRTTHFRWCVEDE